MRRLQAELFHSANALVGEGPTWDSALGALVWVDGLQGELHLTGPDGCARGRVEVGSHIGCALPRAGGGWLLASASDFALMNATGEVTKILTVTGSHLRFNDGKCDPYGRAFAGTVALDRTSHAGALHRLDAGPSTSVVVPNVTFSNGIDWSPDGTVMYYVDSLTQTVWRFGYDLDAALPTDGQPFITIEPGAGIPDGLCVDDDGCVWLALWGGGSVHRYTPKGHLDSVVELPVTQVTSCCFGGAARDQLFITTARKGLDERGWAAQPRAGSVFVTTPGVSGRAATPWAGLPDYETHLLTSVQSNSVNARS